MTKESAMIDRVSKLMTFGGGSLAAGSGLAQGGQPLPEYTLTLADWGIIVGMMVGAIGGAVQIWSWWARWDTKKREEAMAADTKRRQDELAAAELALTQARIRREHELHEAKMRTMEAMR